MKIKKKWISALLMSILCISQISISLQAAPVSSQPAIPESASEYAEAHFDEAISVIDTYQKYYQVTSNDLDTADLGTPFIIYELGRTTQDEIYYYPVLNSDGEIILLLSVMGTTAGWNLSLSEEWVDGLQQIDEITPEYIFYKSGDNLYAENKEKGVSIAGGIDSNINTFKNKSYSEKMRAISNACNNFEKTNTSDIFSSRSNIKATYTPAFSTSTSSSKICALYNKKGQGNYGLCWAATVATICNYRNGTNITAKNVADTMHIGYNEGAYPYEGQQALKNYGLSYNNFLNGSTKLSWSTLKTNINNKYPIYVHASASNSAHVVTAYGYSTTAGTNYVIFWNSGTENSMTVTFKANGTTFSYNNKTYTWSASVSKY